MPPERRGEAPQLPPARRVEAAAVAERRAARGTPRARGAPARAAHRSTGSRSDLRGRAGGRRARARRRRCGRSPPRSRTPRASARAPRSDARSGTAFVAVHHLLGCLLQREQLVGAQVALVVARARARGGSEAARRGRALPWRSRPPQSDSVGAGGGCQTWTIPSGKGLSFCGPPAVMWKLSSTRRPPPSGQ